MTTHYKKILTFLLLTLTLNVIGQIDNPKNSELDTKHIDSLTARIDGRNPKKLKLEYTTSLDSLVGEQVMTIEMQTFKTLCKYTLSTNKSGTRMDVKIVELYLANDTLIKAVVFYDLDKNNFWKKYYYKDNKFFSMLAFPRGMRILLNENGKEFIDIADRLKGLKKEQNQD